MPAASTGSPAAARLSRPRGPDTRLLLGVLLVATSVVAGSRVLAGADRTELVWSAARDLASGIRLTAADVEVRAVRLDAAGANYLPAVGAGPTGDLLTRPVSAGDLLPAAAVVPGAVADDRRQVTVAVSSLHYPPALGRGQLVDVYVTAGPTAASGPVVGAGAQAATPTLVLAGALVVDVWDGGSGFGGPSASVGVVLSVPGDQVAALVSGMRAGQVDLAGVPDP